MRKVIKISLKVLSIVLLALIILPVLAALLFHVEGIQNFAVRKAGEIISNTIGTEVSIESVRLRRFTELEATGVYIGDLAGDTLIYAGTLTGSLSKTAILRKNVIIGDIRLDQGRVYLHKEVGKKINITGVLRTFLDPDREKKGKSNITLRDLYLTNTIFRMNIDKEEPKVPEPGKTDFLNLDFRDVSFGIHNLHIKGPRVTMNIYELEFTDTSGFRVDRLETEEFIIENGLFFKNTSILTPDSYLFLPELTFDPDGKNWKKFSSFMDSVRLKASLEGSDLHSGTMSYVIPGLEADSDIFLKNTDLTFSGTINDFAGEIKTQVMDSTRLEGSYALKGLPDVSRLSFDIDIPYLKTDPADLEHIIGSFLDKGLDSLTTSILHSAGEMGIALKAAGTPNDFTAELDLESGLGSVIASGNAKPQENSTGFEGDIAVSNFDAGALLNTRLLGGVSVNGKVRGKIGGKHLDVSANLGIPKLEFNGYTYDRIWVNAAYDDGTVSGRVSSGNDALRMNLAGSVDLRDSLPVYDVSLNLREADLHTMGLNKRDSVALLKANITAQASGLTPENLNGTITVTDLEYTAPDGTVAPGEIVVTGRNDDRRKFLSLSSDFADLIFASRMGYMEVIDYLRHFAFDYIPALSSGKEDVEELHRNLAAAYEYDQETTSRLWLSVKEANDVAHIFFPEFSIAAGTKIDFLFNPATEVLSLKANSDYIEYGKILATELSLQADNMNSQDTLRLGFDSKELFFSGFAAPSSSIRASAAGNRVDVSVALEPGAAELSAMVNLSADFGRRDNNAMFIEGTFGPSHIKEGARVWEISDRGLIYDTQHIAINDFSITSGAQSLYGNGILSKSQADTLQVRLNDVDLDLLSALTERFGFTLGGVLRGYADLSSVLEKPVMLADISLDGITVNSYTFETLNLRSRWDFGRERASLRLAGQSGKTFVEGFYRPSDGAYIADVDIPALPLSLLEPIFKGAVTDTGGTAAIVLDVRSNASGMPIGTGSVKINDLTATVGMTNAAYRLPEANIKIDKNKAALSSATLFDEENNRAELTAGADLSNFSNISYDFRLVPKGLTALNLGPHDSDLFYGKVYVSGDITGRGGRMGLNINGRVSTDNDSHFTLPLGGKSSVSQADFITFESAAERNEDDLDVLTRKKLMYERSQREIKETRADFNVSATVNVQPNTLVNLIFDADANYVLNAKGISALNVSFNPGQNVFTINGTYEIVDGDFIFSIPGLINNRRFALQPGGTIQWMGEPIDAKLDITAIYRLRATIPESMQSELGGISGRVPIECMVAITENLSQPVITFLVNAPNADADVQNRLNSMLATQERMATEFVWLVAFNSFYPEATEGSQNFDIGMTGAAVGLEFLTSNISNVLSSMSDMADFTFRIKPQDTSSSSEVDIGFTTDIIQNRLLLEVEGNFDTGDNPAAETNNNISGDAALTAIINKSGTLQAKIFTRTINRIFDERRGMQEHGLGIYLREDFDKVSDIFNKPDSRSAERKRKRALKRGEDEALMPEELTEETDVEVPDVYDFE